MNAEEGAMLGNGFAEEKVTKRNRLILGDAGEGIDAMGAEE